MPPDDPVVAPAAPAPAPESAPEPAVAAKAEETPAPEPVAAQEAIPESQPETPPATQAAAPPSPIAGGELAGEPEKPPAPSAPAQDHIEKAGMVGTPLVKDEPNSPIMVEHPDFAGKGLQVTMKPEDITSPDAVKTALRNKLDELGAPIPEDLKTAAEKKEAADIYRSGPEVQGAVGKPTTVMTPNGDHPAVYRVVEAEDLKPSHDPVTFQRNPDYPIENERQYQSNKNAQMQTEKYAKDAKWDLFINGDPTSSNGPSQSLPDGTVLGGNGRAMALQRAYSDIGTGETYKQNLIDHAQEFGIDPAEVAKMDHPVLDRMLTEAPASKDRMGQIGKDLNRDFKKKVSTVEQAVSAGTSLSVDSAHDIGASLAGMGDDSNLRKLFTENPKMFRDIVLKDGILSEGDLPQYFAHDGTLNDAGKDFLENAFLGSVVRDADLLERMPAAVKGKLGRTLAPILELQSRGDAWNIGDTLRAALQEVTAAQAADVNIKDWVRQSSFEKPAPPDDVAAMAEFLSRKPSAVTEGFKQFAADARMDTPNQNVMFGKADPFRSFQEAFGGSLPQMQEYGGVRAPGPGAQNIESTKEGGGSALAGVTEFLNRNPGLKDAPMSKKIDAVSKQVDESIAGESEPNKFVAKIQGTAGVLWDAYKNIPEWTDIKAMTGKFIYALSKSGRQNADFVKAIIKQVPDKLVREGIVNWIQAGGSDVLLKQRAEASDKFRPGYEAALNLTEDQKTLARNIDSYFSAQLDEGIKSGLLSDGITNYVNQIWKSNNAVGDKLISDISNMTSGKLAPNPRFIKRRVFDSYFDGEQAGLEPKNKDIGFLMSAYDQSFNKAVASRAYIKSLFEGKATDGRPLAAWSGMGTKVGDEGGDGAYLVNPNIKPEDAADYRVVSHPALRKWKWATTDEDGKPIIMQGDALIHPEAYDMVNNNLKTSWFRQNMVGRAALRVQAELKSILFAVPGFHNVQIGLHAIFHNVSPFNPAPFDVNDPFTQELGEHGATFGGDENAIQAFGEGTGGGGLLITKIPFVGKYIAQYRTHLFSDYIPRLKVALGQKQFEENSELYPNLSRDQVMELTAKQVNSAFGEQNYGMIGRDPTHQDLLRLGLLAPDFLESRAKFVGQALKPGGQKQAEALIRGAAELYVGARILNKILDDDYHWDRPFSVVVKGREFSLRSVPGDIYHLVSDPQGFAYSRVNPFTVKPAYEAMTGRNQYGQKRTELEQAKDFVHAAEPIPVQTFSKKDNSLIDALFQSVGLSDYQYKTDAEKAAIGYTSDNMPAKKPTEFQRAAKPRSWQPQLVNQVRGMNIEQAIDVYQKGTPQEQALLKPILQRKFHNEMPKLTVDGRRDLMKRHSELFGQDYQSPGILGSPPSPPQSAPH